MTAQPAPSGTAEKTSVTVDVVVVGAGFAGLYALHRLRKQGLSVRVFEAADGVGGVWYWNRYPGARCDVESVDYSYSFDEDLQQEWNWTEKYATQPEILAYLNHVADRFDLRRDISFETRVTDMVLDEKTLRWEVRTDRGDVVSARFCILAVGPLSNANIPAIEGLDSFAGEVYHTAHWPHEGVDFTGKRVGVIGTGSSGIQAIPYIAKEAAQLYVFQRTPNYSVPAGNVPLDDETRAAQKAGYAERRRLSMLSGGGSPHQPHPKSALEVSPEELRQTYERRWELGGVLFSKAFPDQLLTIEANDTARLFWEEKVRAVIDDPAVAEVLIPKDHPIGAKRICTDDNYFQTFNHGPAFGVAPELGGRRDRIPRRPGRSGDRGTGRRRGRVGAGMHSPRGRDPDAASEFVVPRGEHPGQTSGVHAVRRWLRCVRRDHRRCRRSRIQGLRHPPGSDRVAVPAGAGCFGRRPPRQGSVSRAPASRGCRHTPAAWPHRPVSAPAWS